MVSSVSSNNNLSSYFTNIISNLMTIERQPLERLTTQRDTMNIQRAVFVDLQSKINTLRSSTKALISSSPFFALTLGRGTTISNQQPDGATVLSATASSTAPAGIFNINVDHLAQAQTRGSVDQLSGTEDLQKSGSFYIGGTGPDASSAGVSGTPGGKVASVSATKTTGDKIRELGTGQYTIETQTSSSGQLQFRLKDENGDTVQIGSNLSTDWQNVTLGSDFDTMRGMKITFGDRGSATTTKVDYVAVGKKITVAPTDSLVDIANNINDALQPGIFTVSASVVGTQLILSNTQMGTAHRMTYSSWLSTNLGFGASLSDDSQDLQKPLNASLTVNGMPKEFAPSSNTGINDVIHGLTLNLASAGSATVTVSGTTTSARSAVDTFVSNFNDLVTYLDAKTSITKVDDTTYTRGALADDSTFYDLRSSLIQKVMQQVTGTNLRGLSEIGITINDSLQATVSDATKFENALKNNLNGVKQLMDAVAGDILNTLDRFTGTGGYLPSVVSNFDSQIKDLGFSIKDKETYLSDYEVSLVNQYSAMQSQLMLLSYQQQMMSSINSSMSSYG
jgi:flagellar hook-associated protein 2